MFVATTIEITTTIEIIISIVVVISIVVATMYSRTTKSGINVQIKGKPEKVILDTSAHISVINRMLANTLTRPLNLGEVTRHGVGENSWFKANYSHDANIEIERIQFKWPVIIAVKTDQVNSGLDFLCANNAIIDLHDQSINIQGVKLKAQVLKARTRTVSAARVLLKTKLWIPPYTSVHIMGKLDNTLEGEVMIQPNY